MRILMVAMGSRGDVAPYVALGTGLAAAGHEISIAAADDFAELITGNGLAHRRFGIHVEDNLADPLVLRWLAGSDNQRDELRNMRAVAELFAPALADGLATMSSEADAFISGMLTLPALVPVARHSGRRLIAAMLQPMLPTRSGVAHTHAAVPNRDSAINLIASWAMTLGMYPMLKPSIAATTANLGLSRHGVRRYLAAVSTTPTLLGASPLLVPKPADWPAHAEVTGYWRLSAPPGYSPPPALAAFLDAGEPPMYVGFGSMPSLDVPIVRELTLAAIERTGRRAILGGSLHTAAAPVEQLDDAVISLGSVPHDWLFPRTAGVVCHGGAGTTGTALAAGVPVAVVSHMGDQHYWGRRVHELGVGPAPVHRAQLSADRLTQLLIGLADPDVVGSAALLGERLRVEDGVATAVAAAQQWLA